MTELVQVVMPYIPSSAIPVVIVVLGCCYLWNKTRTKFMALENERAKNKKARDKDFQEIRDKCIGNEKEIQFLKEALTDRVNEIKELKSCVSELNVNMGILSTEIKNLTKIIDRLKDG